jgi:hypothetical protein
LTASLIDQGIWVSLSVGIAILAGVFNAYIDQTSKRTPKLEKWYVILSNPSFRDALRLIYAISIPAVALFSQGILSYRGLGLKPLPWSTSVTDRKTLLLTWQNDLELTILLLISNWIILSLGLRSFRINYPKPGFINGIIPSIQESLIEQVHWAFYRELCITIWGIAVGSWITVIPVLLELVLNPATWSRIKSQKGVNSLVANSAIFISSTMLYIQTQNLWLMLCFDMLFRWMFAKIFCTSKSLQRSNNDNSM